MTAETVIFLMIGAAAGGFVNGLAGFGTALFALGWWLQVMPPLQAVALTLALSVLSGLQGVYLVRREIRWRRLLLFLGPAFIGIPVGLQLLHAIDAEVLKSLVAVMLLAYGLFFGLRRELPRMTAETPAIDAGVGFLGGVMGAVAGLSGALPTMWCALRDWSKGETRAVLQPFNVFVLALSAAALAASGVYDGETLFLIAIALPAALLAAQAGIWSFGRLTDPQFRRLLIAMMLLSGLAILGQQLF